ncbi:hypothetical protein C8J56DRAFT_409244 [Mycena floridula]|nr:hypothetical protein C8J56DRAFT_409244 [Mycena floridula]
MASLPSIHEMFSEYLDGPEQPQDKKRPAPPTSLSSRRSFEQPHQRPRYSLSRNVTWDSPFTASEEDEDESEEDSSRYHGRCRSSNCSTCPPTHLYQHDHDATSRRSWDLSRRLNPGEYRQPEIYKAERRPYACPTCQKHFKTPSSLRLHINVHTGETPFKCPDPGCDRSFTVNSNMRRHWRSIHQRKETPDDSVPTFICSFPRCGKEFGVKSNMERHYNTHIAPGGRNHRSLERVVGPRRISSPPRHPIPIVIEGSSPLHVPAQGMRWIR